MSLNETLVKESDDTLVEESMVLVYFVPVGIKVDSQRISQNLSHDSDQHTREDGDACEQV